MHEPLFTNEVVLPKDLPRVEKLQFVPIERSYANILYISYTIFFAVLLGVFLLFILPQIGLVYWLSWALLLCWVALYLLSLWFGYVGVRKKSYALRDKDISYKTGVFFEDWITVPFNRVQHCEITKGVLENAFGLVSLKVYTAGGSGSDLHIPGVKPEIAHQLKEFIINKIKLEDDEEE